MKKQSLNEHIRRMKYLTQYNGKRSVNESVVTNETIDPNEEAAFEKTMTDALNQVMNDLPGELKQAAQTQGNKDGQLDVAGVPTQQPVQPQQTQPVQAAPTQQVQPQQTQPIQETAELDEAIMTALGAGIAAPAIAKIIGAASSYLGKKIGSGDLSQFGEKAKAFGEKMHHTYEHAIDKALDFVLPKNFDPGKKKIMNKLIFYAIIATFFGFGAGGAVHAGAAGNTGLAAAEGGLSSIKFGELVAAARQVLPRVLAATGVS